MVRLLYSVGLPSIILVHRQENFNLIEKFFIPSTLPAIFILVICIGFLRLFEVCVLQHANSRLKTINKSTAESVHPRNKSI